MESGTSKTASRSSIRPYTIRNADCASSPSPNMTLRQSPYARPIPKRWQSACPARLAGVSVSISGPGVAENLIPATDLAGATAKCFPAAGESPLGQQDSPADRSTRMSRDSRCSHSGPPDRCHLSRRGSPGIACFAREMSPALFQRSLSGSSRPHMLPSGSAANHPPRSASSLPRGLLPDR